MPFKATEAKAAQSRFVFPWRKQSLRGRYNAGEKYAAMQEKMEADGYDGRPLSEEERAERTIEDARREFSELICMVVEEWDYEQEDGSPLPIDAKVLADEGHPIEFYTGLLEKIADDYNAGASGGKGRSGRT